MRPVTFCFGNAQPVLSWTRLAVIGMRGSRARVVALVNLGARPDRTRRMEQGLYG